RRGRERFPSLTFQGQFGLETGAVTSDRGDRDGPAFHPVSDRAVAPLEAARDLHVVPPGGVADVGDRDVVMLAPEEGHGGKRLPPPQDVACGRLPLALGG